MRLSNVVVLATREASASWRFRAPASVSLKVQGNEVATADVKRNVPAAFAASETFDVGIDLGSPVSPGYFDRRPFRLIVKVEAVTVKLLK
jgi:arylsulfatase